MLFSKEYFHDRVVTSLLALNSLLVFIQLALLIVKVDMRLSVIGTRYIPALNNYVAKGNPMAMYEYLLFALLITMGSLFLSARLYQQRRGYALFCLSMVTVLLVFSLAVSGALLAL